MGTDEFNVGGNPAVDQHAILGGIEIVAPCYGNRNKFWLDGPLGLYADLILPYLAKSGLQINVNATILTIFVLFTAFFCFCYKCQYFFQLCPWKTKFSFRFELRANLSSSFKGMPFL